MICPNGLGKVSTSQLLPASVRMNSDLEREDDACERNTWGGAGGQERQEETC